MTLMLLNGKKRCSFSPVLLRKLRWGFGCATDSYDAHVRRGTFQKSQNILARTSYPSSPRYGLSACLRHLYSSLALTGILKRQYYNREGWVLIFLRKTSLCLASLRSLVCNCKAFSSPERRRRVPTKPATGVSLGACCLLEWRGRHLLYWQGKSGADSCGWASFLF